MHPLVWHLVAVVTALSALAWLWSAYAIARTLRELPKLRDDRSPPPARWPRVSLIVAARDEERELEHAVRTRLEDDYPDLQVVIVDDRSSDRTPEIADRLAADDPRVRVVHLTELPAGWLGKLHAMHQGTQVADGAWLLYSDADVEFSPGTLRRAVAYCEHNTRDHMAILPGFREHGFVLDATIDVFCHTLVTGGRLWRVPDMNTREAVGGGMFNLVRRSAFERTPGFPWLRMEVADDVALGQMLKRHGARPAVLDAVGCVTLDFYRTVGEMARGIEKTGLTVIGRFRYTLLAAVCALGLLVNSGYLLGFAHPSPGVRGLAVITALVAAAGNLALVRAMGRSTLAGLAHPLGMVMMMWMALRSGWLTWRRGGVAWRNTLYRLDELRAGSRVELM